MRNSLSHRERIERGLEILLGIAAVAVVGVIVWYVTTQFLLPYLTYVAAFIGALVAMFVIAYVLGYVFSQDFRRDAAQWLRGDGK